MDEETTKTYLKRLMSEKASSSNVRYAEARRGTMQSMKDSTGGFLLDNHPLMSRLSSFERKRY